MMKEAHVMQLTPREQHVYRYAKAGITRMELSRALDITPQRVGAIYKKALKKLKLIEESVK